MQKTHKHKTFITQEYPINSLYVHNTYSSKSDLSGSIGGIVAASTLLHDGARGLLNWR